MEKQVIFILIISTRMILIHSESCIIPSTNQNGICTSITQCITIQNELKKDRSKVPVICNQSQRTICCPLSLSSDRNSLKLLGLPETQSNSIDNQQAFRLNEACSKYRDKMIKNHTVTSFIIGEPGEHVPITYCNINHTDIGVAVEKEFPHVVYIVGRKLLKTRNSKVIVPEQQVADTKCSGSLITENFILTIALCASNTLHSSAVVYFGVYNLTADDFRAHSQVEVPNYNIRTYLEVTLLRLPQRIEINEAVLPVCLSSTTNNKFVLAGWTGYRYECNPIMKKWYIESNEVENCRRSHLCISTEKVINYYETLLAGTPLHVYHPNSNCQYIMKGLFIRVFEEKYEFIAVSKYLEWIEQSID